MNKDRKEIINGIFLILHIAVSMMVSLCLGGFFGWLLGKWLGVSFLTLIGFLFGAAAGYRNVYDMVRRYIKNPPKPEAAYKPSEEEINRMKAEEEFRRWRQERNSDDRG